MKDKDRFSLTEGIIYGAPLSRPKDVAAWEQRERIVKAQEGLRTGMQSQAHEIARQVQAGHLSQEQGRAEMANKLSAAIHGFVDQQRAIREGISHQTNVLQEGIQGVIQGQESIANTIQDETRRQTGSLVAAQHFQTGNLLGDVASLPIQLEQLGIGDETILKLIANGALGVGSPGRRDIENRLDPLQLKILDGTLTESDKKSITSLEQSEPNTPYRKLARMKERYHDQSTLALVQSGEISPQAAEMLIRHQKLSARGTEALLEARVVAAPLGTSRRMNIALDDQTRIQGAQLQVQGSQLSALRSMLDQNERRDFLLASVDAGIRGIMGSTLEQTKLQASLVSQSRRQIELAEIDLDLHYDQLDEARRQTSLQGQSLAELARQTDLQEAHLMSSERTNELLETMTRDLAGRIDFTNASLGVMSQQLDQLIGSVIDGLQKACLVFAEGFKAMGKEIALTRFVIGKNVEQLTKVTLTGFSAIDTRLAQTNELLQELLQTLKSPEETRVRESMGIAARLIQSGNLKGALDRLQKTNPDEHDFEVVHFLIGYVSYKQGDAVTAAHYLGWAKKYAGTKQRADVAEYAGVLLAQMALELGEFSLSSEALESLVADRSLAPHLKKAHGEFAALQSFAGNTEQAIDSTINQIITNPASVDEIIGSSFIDGITRKKNYQKWHKELIDLVQQHTSQDNYLSYIALSIFVVLRLDNPNLVEELLKTSLRIRKKQLRPLRRRDVEGEIQSISHKNATQLNGPLNKLTKTSEFNWLK
jgi:hypothetical protein